MKRSKHFRKDVIIARIIFVVLCSLLCVLIGSGVSAFLEKMKENQDLDTQKQNTQSPNTQIQTGIDTQDTEIETSVEDTQTTEEVSVYAITTTEVRLRQEPNTDCEVLGSIPSGTRLLVLEQLEGWYKVSYEEKTGYISADYATIEKEEETAIGIQYVVMLDPGHQLNGDSEKEPNGPGSSELKARVTGGATGSTTGVTEYELTLEIALMLREELQNRGYTVLMTRETHDVNISNKERAEMANQAGADITVRIHGNSYTDSSVNGAETLAPSTSNPYAGDIAEGSQKLAHEILAAYCELTGMNNRGVKIDDTMTGINWCEMPVTIIELGFMSNETDDTNMQDDAYQQKMIKGIADGIDAYFGS